MEACWVPIKIYLDSGWVRGIIQVWKKMKFYCWWSWFVRWRVDNEICVMYAWPLWWMYNLRVVNLLGWQDSFDVFFFFHSKIYRALAFNVHSFIHFFINIFLFYYLFHQREIFCWIRLLKLLEWSWNLCFSVIT